MLAYARASVTGVDFSHGTSASVGHYLEFVRESEQSDSYCLA
jgi:hypothetical protein